MQNNVKNKIFPSIFFALILVLWEIVSRTGMLADFILPAPTKILLSLVFNFKIIYWHIAITLFETLIGFTISIVFAVVIAISMDAVMSIKRTLYPILIISQTLPIIILAPLFIIWFGYGYLPKIIIVILICFFPICINLLNSLAASDREFIDLLRSMGANKKHIYKFVKIPSAMPGFFSGLKIAATYSIMGATIGEWVGGKNGLGVYMIRAKQSFATDRVFAAIIIITALSIIFLKIIEFAEKKHMPWLRISADLFIEET